MNATTSTPVSAATAGKDIKDLTPDERAAILAEQKTKAAGDAAANKAAKPTAKEKAKAAKEKEQAKVKARKEKEAAAKAAKKVKEAEKKAAAKAKAEARKLAIANGEIPMHGMGILRKYAPTYRKDKEKKTSGGHISVDCGDELAAKLRGKSLDEVYTFAAKALGEPEADLRKKYGKLNLGQQRMNLGNRVRATLKGAKPKVTKVKAEKAPKTPATTTAPAQA